ncbi:MAG: beta-glucosidase [Acidobacteria bacterium]|nr:MAG: beta-glucosidase [Acidobacteriota bacterium]
MQDLLKRMTLEEKVDQLSSWRRSAMSTDNAEAQQIVEKIQKLSEPGSQVGPRDTAVLRNEAQKFLVERTRLGIPALFQGEALHGFMSNGSTSFPQVLGLASTWDPELVERVFSAAADEMAAAGVRQAFTPVLDLARDPRWGRTEETYGEDPFLVSRMGVAAIRGLQGTSFVIDRHHVLATAKHFAAHGQPEGGRNTAPANYSERILRESFFMPFQAAVEEAHVASVMASYNEIDGIPSHINHWLLDRVLRQEWQFQGYVTSDGGGLQMLVNTHHVAADYAEAARKALAAGVDFDLSDGSVYQTLIEQARRGIIPEKQIDDAVERVLAAKFRLGLFENPYADPDYAAQVTNSREHKELALKAAEEAIVLLKNEGNLLPLDGKKIKSVAVIGPNAADVHLGGYSRDPGPGNQVSILEGIRQRVGAGIKLLYAEGCKLTSAKPGWAGWYVDNVALIDPPTQAQSIQEAAVLARQADVAILVVGENESTNREAWSERHLGDRDSLDLLGAQDKLVQAVIDTGIPTVVFLINGRPLSINYAAQHARAIIEGWYLGEQGGIAAARVLFGDINPGGKLPVTFPRSVGQIPAYYDHKPSRDRSYAFTNSQPLFPFGYGLSYTTFGFDNLRVEPALMDAGGTTTVRVEVTNTGNREGAETPQLYMHQRVASVTQPVKQLRGFRRVSLRPGEKTTVEFLITPETLSILDINMRGRVEPGTFDIMVGPDSEHTATVPLQIFARE